MRHLLTGRRPLAILAAIVALGLALRVWGLTWGLANATVSTRVHPDEWTVYWLFRWFDLSHTPNPCPNAQTSCFFDWGTAFPYLAYVAHWVLAPLYMILPHNTFGARADMYFVSAVLAGRAVSVVLSSATIVVAYLLARELYGVAAGLATALLVSFSGLLIQLAHFGTPDSTTLFLMSLALLGVARASTYPDRRRFMVAGGLIGAAAGSEFHMALLVLPLITAWLLAQGRRWAWLAASAGAMAVIFVTLNPYVLVEFPAFIGAFEHSVRMRTVDSRLQYGDRFDSYGPDWLYVLRYPLGFGVGFALSIWLIAGAVLALVRRRQADVLLLSWVAPYFLLVSLAPAKFMRYSAPLLVPLAVLGGRAAAVALQRSPRVQRGVVASALLLALVYSATYDAAYAGLFSSTDPRQVAATWISAHAGERSRVAYEAPPDGLLNLPDFVARAGYTSCFANGSATKILGVRYVAVDDYVFDEASPTEAVEIHSLRDELSGRGQYRIATRVAYVPTFLGLKFPISASPHDWKYPAHDITVYVRSATTRGGNVECFRNPDVADFRLGQG